MGSDNKEFSGGRRHNQLLTNPCATTKLIDACLPPLQLIPLPRTPSVADILDSYASSQSSRPSSRSAALTTEVIAGLKLYFEKSLGNNLLYKFERNQYGEAKKRYCVLPLNGDESGMKEMNQVYGVEHLMRLFGGCMQIRKWWTAKKLTFWSLQSTCLN